MSVLYDEIAADLEKFQVPGASWAVIDGGELVDTGCAGVVQADESAAVVPETLFQACSISKPVAVFAMPAGGPRTAGPRSGRQQPTDLMAGSADG